MDNTQEIYEEMFKDVCEAYDEKKKTIKKYKEGDCSITAYAAHVSMLMTIGDQMSGIVKYVSPKKPSTNYKNVLTIEQGKATNHCFSCRYFRKIEGKTIGLCTHPKMSVKCTGIISNESHKFDDWEHNFQKRNPNQTCCMNYKMKEEKEDDIND